MEVVRVKVGGGGWAVLETGAHISVMSGELNYNYNRVGWVPRPLATDYQGNADTDFLREGGRSKKGASQP